MSAEIRRRKAHSDTGLVSDVKSETSSSDSTGQSKPAVRSRRSKSFPVWFVFTTIWSVRIVSAIFNPISDCDEVFNYWEPIHNLLFRTGLQTWEYSPDFALRSYLYLLLHAIPIGILDTLVSWTSTFPSLIDHVNTLYVFDFPVKVVYFYALRLLLATLCAVAETCFVRSAAAALKRTLGTSAQHSEQYLLLFTAFGPGMFLASSALLPQSFVLTCLLLAHSAWLDSDTAHPSAPSTSSASTSSASTSTTSPSSSQAPATRRPRYGAVVWWCAVAAIVGCWPFVLIVVLPTALDVILAFGVWRTVYSALLSAASLLGLSVLVDRHFYGRTTLALLNLAVYNASSEHGPTLYGVEPLSFYIKNLALNWNLVFLCGALGPLFALLLALCTPGKRAAALRFLKWVSGGLLWVAVMFAQPHKEERFLIPVYHLLVLSATYFLAEFPALLAGELATSPHPVDDSKSSASTSASASAGRRSGLLGRLFRVLFASAFLALSVSRCAALVVNYRAPLPVWLAVARSQTEATAYQLARDPTPIPGDTAPLPELKATRVCVGKEWYRFPSSFFLPHSHLLFLRSGFRGQLPQPFAVGANNTSVRRDGFNDENKEEESRYADLAQCDYIVDLDLPNQACHTPCQEEEHFNRHPDFRVIYQERYLFAEASPQLTRALYIPYLSAQRNLHRPYQLLRRVRY